MKGVQNNKMKIGLNPAFLFAHYGDKVFFNEIIEGATLAKNLNFSSLGLEVYCDSQYDAYTPKNIRAIREHYINLGLNSTAFVACAPRAKLASINAKVCDEGKRDFERIADITAELGLTDIVALVTSAPPESVISYMDTYPGAPPKSILLPPGSTWEGIWNSYIETVGECLEMVRKRGLRLALEPTTMSIVSNSDSYLRFAGEIKSKHFGILIDAAHLFFQREYLPIVIEKVKDSIFGFCACDNDGAHDYHWAPGRGKINWQRTLEALKKVGYKGYIDLEINVSEEPNSTYQRAREFLEEILKEKIL